MQKSNPTTRLRALVILSIALFLSGSVRSAVPAEHRLPRFEVKLTDGTVLRSKDLTGKITVIDFWGTWCPPCLKEIPAYNSFYKEYKSRGIGFYGMAADSGTAQELREAAVRLKIEYPVAALTDAELDEFGDIPVFPTTWVINRHGVIEQELIGSGPGKQKLLRDTVDDLLKNSSK